MCIISIWVFTLLAVEAVKTSKTSPTFAIGTYKIPTWTTPFIAVLLVSFIVPNTSLLGHLCGMVFGYGCMSRPFTLCKLICLQVRGPWIYQVPSTTRMGVTMVGREIKSTRKIATLCVSGSENLWEIWSAPVHVEFCREWPRPWIYCQFTEVRPLMCLLSSVLYICNGKIYKKCWLRCVGLRSVTIVI